LQILDKRIIVDVAGEIIDYELDSPLVCFCSLRQNLSTLGNGEGGSEHVPLGASVFQRPPTQDVERFLSMLRFDSREQVNALGDYADPEASKTGT
jgi:hypothetical protein